MSLTKRQVRASTEKAYMWGCTMANVLSPKQKFVACPNQDVVYGFGMMELDRDPVVIQPRARVRRVLEDGGLEPRSPYIRAYWGRAPILDGSWIPPRIAA